MAMTDSEFDTYLEACLAALEEKQSILMARHALGMHAHWHFDHSKGELEFSSPDKPTVRFRARGIGTFSRASQNFQWTWATQSIPPSIRHHSQDFQQLAQTTGMNIFSMPMFNASEEMGWEVTAMCVEHTGALGGYRGPTNNVLNYFLIESVLAD